MPKKIKIIFFIEKATPSKDEQKAFDKLSPFAVFRNASLVPKDKTAKPEKCDGVAGAVPAIYKSFPSAETALKEAGVVIGQKAGLNDTDKAVLEKAEKDAKAIVEKAEKEAEKIKTKAEDEANKIVNKANEEAKAITDKATTEAAEIKKAAQSWTPNNDGK